MEALFAPSKLDAMYASYLDGAQVEKAVSANGVSVLSRAA
jgi:hypothetical protein